MSYTLDQERVLSEAAAWLEDPGGSQIKYMAGYAGTGKTTLARDLGCEAGALFAAYTGKAALVMAQKGCPSPSTLHALLYVPVDDRDEHGKHVVRLIRREDSPLLECPLLVIDECSMVDGPMAADLLTYACRLLVIGDPAQLPPVGGGGFFTEREPDWLLTEVHRQAKESGILRLATEVRESGRYSRVPGAYGDDVAVLPMAALDADEFASLDRDHEQVIVGTNARRHAMNQLLRATRGFTDELPEAADKIVCLRNDNMKGLQNGSLYNVVRPGQRGDGYINLRILAEDKGSVDLDVCAHDQHFRGCESKLEDIPWMERRRRQEFDYGYAITCHKSQGSSWPGVVVVDESRVFRKDAKRWLYTAVTRASERLVVVT